MSVHLIGRDEELRLVQSSLADGAEDLSVAVIEGAAGLGKTALIEGALAASGVGNVLRAGGRIQLVHEPLGLVSQLTGRVDLAEAEPDADVGLTVFRSLGVLLDLLADMTTAGPAVMFIDDLQWVDRSSVEVLTLLRSRLAHEPVTLLLATRPVPSERDDIAALLDGLAEQGAPRATVDPLPDPEARALVREIAVDAPSSMVEDCISSARGNPLLLQHLASSILTGDARATTLAPVVRQQLAGMSPPAAATIRIAAVGGTDIDAGALAEVTGASVPAVIDQLHEAVAAGLVRAADPMWRFEHDLLHEAVLDLIAGAEKRQLHRAWAAALHPRGGRDGQSAAEHLLAAGPRYSSDELEIIAHAASRALLTEPERAAELYAVVIKCSSQGDVHHDRARTGYAEAHLLAGRSESGSDVRGAVDHLTALRHELRQGRVSRATLHDAEIFARETEHERRRDESLALIAKIGSASFNPLRHLIDELDARADELSPTAQVWLRSAQDRLFVMTGRFIETGWVGEQARLAAEALPEDHPVRVEAALIFGRAASQTGERADEGLAALAWAERQAEALGRVGLQLEAHHDNGMVLQMWNRWDEADAHFRAGIDLAREVGAATMLQHLEWRLVQITTGRGDFGESERLIANQAGRPDPIGVWAMEVGNLQLLQGDVMAAIETLAPLVTARDVFPEVRRNALIQLAQAAFEVDDDRARRAVRDGSALLTGDALPTRLCRALVTASVDGDRELAHRALADTADAPPYVRSQHALLAGIAQARGGDADAAVGLFEQSRELGVDRGGTAVVRAIDRWLNDLGVAPPRPIERPTTGWGSLTPAELRVAEVVAEGLVYREIAERLFISRRTVESHVASALRKLGLKNRSQLATSFLSEGAVGTS